MALMTDMEEKLRNEGRCGILENKLHRLERRLLAAFYIEVRLMAIGRAGEHAGHDCKKFVCLGFDGIGAGRGNSAFFIQKF